FPTTAGVAHPTSNGLFTNTFVAKLSPTGVGTYSTYLATSPDNYTTGQAIAVDASGSAHIAGLTAATNFPVTAGALQSTLKTPNDVYLVTLNPTGSAPLYSTYFGGNGDD